MGKVHESIISTIGRTPVVRLNKIAKDVPPTVLVKLEAFNPAGSVKDRIAMSMIEAAERAGLIKPGESHVVEPTSGNTGVGLAMVCAAKGYQLTLTMPESMSLERRKILKAFGANLVLTPASGGMKAAIEKAQELAEKDGKVFIPQQFKNKANPEVHRQTTAREIIEDTGGKLDAFVAGVGTGGTVTGVGEVLKKELGGGVKVFAVEPKDSPVLSGGSPGPHKIQGIGAGFVPDVLNTKVYDEVIAVAFEDAVATSRALASQEGIFVGISSGAAAWAALHVAPGFSEDQVVLAVLPDTGERYLTTDLWNLD
ncbi:MAG: cysteine synthase A [Promethearchaeota archaeon]